MTNDNMRQMGFIGLGALAGIAVAMLANRRMTRRGDSPDYFTQSGERDERSDRGMEQRDREVFREEVTAER
jgi:hypothetical protein